MQRTLARDLKQRYATADELLYDLEFYIYNYGYGPTNETLGKYVRDLFDLDLSGVPRPAKGGPRLTERTARLTTRSTARKTTLTRNSKKTIRIT